MVFSPVNLWPAAFWGTGARFGRNSIADRSEKQIVVDEKDQPTVYLPKWV